MEGEPNKTPTANTSQFQEGAHGASIDESMIVPMKASTNDLQGFEETYLKLMQSLEGNPQVEKGGPRFWSRLKARDVSKGDYFNQVFLKDAWQGIRKGGPTGGTETRETQLWEQTLRGSHSGPGSHPISPKVKGFWSALDRLLAILDRGSLAQETDGPIRMLDCACGDLYWIMPWLMLRARRVKHMTESNHAGESRQGSRSPLRIIEYVGIDVSARVLDAAQQRIMAAKMEPFCKILQCDCSNEDAMQNVLQNGHFDIVLSKDTLNHMDADLANSSLRNFSKAAPGGLLMMNCHPKGDQGVHRTEAWGRDWSRYDYTQDPFSLQLIKVLEENIGSGEKNIKSKENIFLFRLSPEQVQQRKPPPRLPTTTTTTTTTTPIPAPIPTPAPPPPSSSSSPSLLPPPHRPRLVAVKSLWATMTPSQRALEGASARRRLLNCPVFCQMTSDTDWVMKPEKRSRSPHPERA